MAGPIYIAGTPLCEVGLGGYGGNAQGGVPSANLTGSGARTGVMSGTITIRNPAGARLGCEAAIEWGPAANLTTTTCGVQGSAVIDGGAQSVYGTMLANNNTLQALRGHQFRFSFLTGVLAAGAHTINLGLYVWAGSAFVTGNGGALVYEIP